MPDQDRIKGWLNKHERLGNFGMDRLKAYAEYVGNHYFEPSTLRFFRSRVSDSVYFGRGRTYFVTSEQFVDGRGNAASRRYTIRVASIDNGDGILGLHIDTVGEFQEYATSATAHRHAARIAQAEEDREPTEEEAAILARAEADIAEKDAEHERRHAAIEERRRLAAAAGRPW